MDPLKGAADREEELRALLVLDGLPGVGPVRVRAAVEAFGGARRALLARGTSFAAVLGREAASARGEPERKHAIDQALETAERAGMTVVIWDDAAYPDALRHLADPPPVLFLKGRADLLGAPAVTVVGARRATARARDVAERIGSGLARAGHVVASGLALGVDGAAHRGALGARGATLAVLGSGADQAYPRSHVRIFRHIVEHGLVISEFLPGTPALPHHFPRRNRILAALGSATVVVEAGARSGSLITVDHALDLGRDVWVVPGPIERATCAGSNRLLLEGARPLLSVAHLVSALGTVEGAAAGSLHPSSEPRSARPTPSAADAPVPPGADDSEPIGRDPSERPDGQEKARRDGRILDLLADGPLSGDEMARRLGWPPSRLLPALTRLEMDGVVRRLPDLRFGRAA